MKKTEVVLRELKKKIITRDDIDKIAEKYKFNPLTLRKLLLNKKYIITIFRGIYYLRSYEERKFSIMRFSPYEFLSLGLNIKNVKWYFGLNTALNFLNLTHEVFPINYVINNKFSRIKPIKIAGSKFLFIKIKPSLFFGIKKKKTKNNIFLYYSNLEKTILDLVYLKKDLDLREYDFSRKKLFGYLRYYDNRTKKKIKLKVKNE